MIAYLKAKEREKLDEAERKAKAKQAREDKRMAKQAEMERKAEKRAEREAKRKGKQAETGRKATSKARTAKGGKEERQYKSQGAVKSVRLPANGSDSEVSDEGICALCYSDDPGQWISCDACGLWYHLSCVGLTDTITAEWRCQSCDH